MLKILSAPSESDDGFPGGFIDSGTLLPDISGLISFTTNLLDKTVKVTKAENCAIIDADGKKYLDAFSASGGVSVGHSNPFVNEAAHRQIDLFSSSSKLYQTKSVEKFQIAIQKYLPKNVNKYHYLNSGSEAVDFSCQALRAYTGKKIIISFSESCHGSTHIAKSISGLENFQNPSFKDPDVFFYKVKTCRNCPEKIYKKAAQRIPGLEIECIINCIKSIEDFLEKNRINCAGIVIETIMPNGGMIIPSKGFFSRLNSICSKWNLPIVVSEVNSGNGRCGKDLFAFEEFGIKPSMVCLGNSITNGFPFGVTIATQEISDSISDIKSFLYSGGNPVSCAAATATLNYIENNNLLKKAKFVGEFIQEELEKRLQCFQAFVDVRGKGLMIGVETESSEFTEKIIEFARRNFLLIGIGGRSRNVIRIEPPLTFSAKMANTLISILESGFKQFSHTKN
ncbi:MAG: aminotransferase class III-fold pyridoxal phosphate-dependent enzyme [Candidatus Riflebacteria bacterium]|nr:aminotransferase class III-fold pyridoxal phosphate-dependent enzyme [Candidatus Riflebacteria bacterium]